MSSYQGTIDWTQVAGSGISFAFIKATEGTAITDSQFSANFTGAKAAGILRGAYHFAHPGQSSPSVQANHFLQVVQGAGTLDLPPVLDMEDNGGLSNQALATWIESFATQVHQATGKLPLLYTYPYFADAYLPASLSNLPLWIANYGVSQPPNTSGWTSWTFWQYSDTGSIPGISTSVDLDVYSGTVTQLNAQYGTGSASPTPSQPTYTQFTVFVLDHPYVAIAVNNVTYVLWTALNTLGTPHTYRGSGVMNINGKDVQGVVYQGNTYLPWDSLATNIKSEKVWHFYT